ncbi:MAG: tyrosine-protein phosphatase [Verrucomicrobiota bacterium]
MIDLHSHILPGIDDGARTMDDSLDIARAAVMDGIDTIAGTPHVRDDWPTDAGLMEDRVAELRAELELAGIPLDVRTGGELAIDWLTRLTSEELRRFGLGGSRYLLVETPYYGWPRDLPDRLFSLLEDGFAPVLAHPERNADVAARPDLLVPLVEEGVVVQVTAASVDGRIGRRAFECARVLIREGLVHLLASDAHHASVREVGMSGATKRVGDPALARWLALDVPAAILADREIPPRPRSRPPKRWLGRLLEL